MTYVLECKSCEYYCGKTDNIFKRLDQHRNEKYPHWFSNDSRRDFVVVLELNGDYEKKIKKFGVKNFIECITGAIQYVPTPMFGGGGNGA